MLSLISFLKKEKLFSLLFISILLLSLRNLFLNLQADEITYSKIATNILNGRYYQKNHPSTVIPVMPFLMALFNFSKAPYLGFALQKFFHILLTILGFRFCYLTLSKLNLDKGIIYSILLMTSISTNFISFLPSLYPESILFVSFWGFMYYLNQPKTVSNFKKFFLLFILLVFTRYLYAILGLLVLMYYYSFFINSKKHFWKLLILSLTLTTPLFLWFKYVYHIESQNLSEISYFNRFKTGEHPLLYNIKCGLGLEKHYEVSRVNGIPAFTSLFVPITGFRNFYLSLVLLLAVFFGLYQKVKNTIVFNFLITFFLVMFGFVLAGTGFNRYWLVLLPIIYLGYFFIYDKYIHNPTIFIKIIQIISVILILNEIRITSLILNKIL
ncbi:hypothetical protein [Flavobacterium sp. UMI-01]|uniref:hypothetical protein n=1 Tax=Flavobacterium sp. UMI-01 TaxID=1441053 RepID=UPI001C7CC786|nr:hypothetical protein [Flavobacterium sp. UMI-01]